MSDSKFDYLYKQLDDTLQQYINPNITKEPKEEIDPDIVGYDAAGEPIKKGDITSKIVSLDHHVLNIERNKNKITIKSLIDPTITGFVNFENDDDSNLAYSALDTNTNIISFLNNHYDEDTTAIEWSKIISDEFSIQHETNKTKASAKVDSNRSDFNDSDAPTPDNDTDTADTDDNTDDNA